MAMDVTDAKLLKGIVLFAVLGLVVYYYPFSWPFESYQVLQEKMDRVQQEIEPVKGKFGEVYDPPPPNVWDPYAPASETEHLARMTTVAERKTEYEQVNAKLREEIAKLQKDSRMNFADWCTIPEAERQVGTYWITKYEVLCKALERETRNAGVILMDPYIGFNDVSNHTLTREQAQDELRKLHIADTIIRLCVKAKKEEEEEKRRAGLRPEAYMRIIKVVPQKSDKTGPQEPEINPEYDPKILNPNDKRFDKFVMKKYPEFIKQYPVEILLQCDLHSFRKFLQAVRTPGQFLVIRSLKVVSPLIQESQRNTLDYEQIKGDYAAIAGKDAMQTFGHEDSHIWVRLSASGMDFFEPKEPVVASQGEAGDDGVPSMFRKPGKGVKVEPAGH